MLLDSNPYNFRSIEKPACCINCRFAVNADGGPACHHPQRRTGEVDETVDGFDVYWRPGDDVDWNNVCDLHAAGDPNWIDDAETPEIATIRKECEAELIRAHVEAKDKE